MVQVEDITTVRVEKATFAGGCFWCMVHPFDEYSGVLKVVSGYTGGHTANPTYEEVCSHTTGHREAVEIAYNPAIISYEKLLDIFWHQIDPTDAGGQFYDRGPSYQTVIYYHSNRQRQAAQESKIELSHSGRFNKPIVTEILPAPTFYAAEAYHQDFYKTNAAHYKRYRMGSGRDFFIETHWQ